mmetsp:Transcript_37002/g.41326  ORF Transcript_37002/g.41326 Transcript_37002/m.41326 type:complete len:86 (+) Transcript_37002:152-409(+)
MLPKHKLLHFNDVVWNYHHPLIRNYRSPNNFIESFPNKIIIDNTTRTITSYRHTYITIMNEKQKENRITIFLKGTKKRKEKERRQ